MDFTIDSKYQIRIIEQGFTDGEDGNPSEAILMAKIILHISKDGKVILNAK